MKRLRGSIVACEAMLQLFECLSKHWSTASGEKRRLARGAPSHFSDAPRQNVCRNVCEKCLESMREKVREKARGFLHEFVHGFVHGFLHGFCMDFAWILY